MSGNEDIDEVEELGYFRTSDDRLWEDEGKATLWARWLLVKGTIERGSTPTDTALDSLDGIIRDIAQGGLLKGNKLMMHDDPPDIPEKP